MPAGDRTGPRAMGSRTGRGAGYCTGFEIPGYATPIPGRGYGFGGGYGIGRGGWGRRNWFIVAGTPGRARFPVAQAWRAAPYVPPPAVEDETAFLKNQAEWLKGQLDAITKRIEEIGSED